MPDTKDSRDRDTVRNIVIVAGYDYVNLTAAFDAPALDRIRALIDQKEHERHPVRFHYFSAASGVVAESIVFGRPPVTNPRGASPSAAGIIHPPNAAEQRALRVGTFWQRVETRFKPITPDDYRASGSGGHPTLKPEERKEPRAPKVLSIVDLYTYLQTFGPDPTARPAPPIYDSLLELSFFGHVARDSIHLVGSEDRRVAPGRRLLTSRDPSDKDGRATDFAGFRADVRDRLRGLFDRQRGRICLYGGLPTVEANFYFGLLSDTIRSPEYATSLRVRTPSLVPDHSLGVPGDTRIQVLDSNLKAGLQSRGIDPEKLTFSQVISLVEVALRGTYAQAAVDGLGVPVIAAPPGVRTEIRDGRIHVPNGFDRVLKFYQDHFLLGLSPGRFAIFGDTRRAAAIEGRPEDTGARSPLAGVMLFPPVGELFQEKSGSKLQNALEEAIRSVQKDAPKDQQENAKRLRRVPFAIADLTAIESTIGYPYAGVLDTELHFSASLLKVTGIFSAYRLRDAVRAIAAQMNPGLDATALFKEVAAQLDPVLKRALDLPSRGEIEPNNRGPTLTRDVLLPTYAELLSVQGGGSKYFVEINRSYADKVDEIFTVVDNGPASYMIHRIGYLWINATLQFGGFPGLWLAADYIGDWPYVVVESKNDGAVGQAMKARDMAKLFAHIERESSQNPVSLTTDVKKHLAHQGSALNPFTQIDSVACKIGLGPLKRENGGYNVRSEGSIRIGPSDAPSPFTFVLVWQNLPEPPSGPRENDFRKLVAQVFEATVKTYLGL